MKLEAHAPTTNRVLHTCSEFALCCSVRNCWRAVHTAVRSSGHTIRQYRSMIVPNVVPRPPALNTIMMYEAMQYTIQYYNTKQYSVYCEAMLYTIQYTIPPIAIPHERSLNPPRDTGVCELLYHRSTEATRPRGPESWALSSESTSH